MIFTVAKNMLSSQGVAANAAAYHARYIKPGGFAPVVHTMVGMFLIGYSLEHAHLKHAQEEEMRAKYGGAAPAHH